MTRLECAPVFISRSGGIVALLGYATHIPGEEVMWDDRRRVFIYPGHGETYDVDGWPIEGPTAGPLLRCPLRIDDGNLILDVPLETEGPHIQQFCEQPGKRTDLVLVPE